MDKQVLFQDEKASILYRIDGIIAEFNNYLNGGNPGGNSVTQRLEFWKAARYIIAENFFLGVGTGDVEDAFQRQYDIMDSPLEPKYRLRAHNQFLTITVTFGLLGLLIFLLSFTYPIWSKHNRKNALFVSFFVFAILSFLAEDTLETQAGITFISFFGPFFLFQCDKLFRSE